MSLRAPTLAGLIEADGVVSRQRRNAARASTALRFLQDQPAVSPGAAMPAAGHLPVSSMKSDITACLPHVVLREQTRVEHERVEATAAMRHLFHDPLNVSSYAQLLRRYLELHAAWENRHATWLRGLVAVGWTYESRLPALECDLESLGDVSEAPVRKFESVATLSAWGALYVIEGSLLGGQVIARHLAGRFPAHPHRFFNLGSHRPAHAWKDFQILLDAALASPGDMRSALSQAKETFALFQTMFEALPANDRDGCIAQA